MEPKAVARVGDKIVMTEASKFDLDLTVGKTYTVTGVQKDGDVFVLDDVGEHNALLRSQYEVTVEPQPAPEGAKKFDSGKPPIGLIPRSALNAEAAALGFGATKYGRDNWRQGMDWSRVIDAAFRHLSAFADGEDRDVETGLVHLAHLKACASFLIEYHEKGLGNDDRPKTVSV